MEAVITAEQLRLKIEKLEASVARVNAKKVEMEGQLKIYRSLLQEATSGNGASDALPSASDAILELLRGRELTTSDMMDGLKGRFATKSDDPRSAIYAAVDALKKKRLIEPCPGDGRRYRLIGREDGDCTP